MIYYIIFSYFIILGSLIETNKFSDNDLKFISTLLFAPILFPIFIGMVFTKYYNEGKNQQNE